MPVLVDGDNLLGSWPRRSRSDAERRALHREISRVAQGEGKSIILFYDGPSPAPISLGSDVHFSGPGRRADDMILEHLRRQQDRRGFLVVTNDRSLGDQCRWLGARVERCDIFRKRLLATSQKEEPAERIDVDYWLGVFGDED